ncbi:MAG: F0F1 ATP synthase subunit B [Pseudomonadota bacterium]
MSGLLHDATFWTAVAFVVFIAATYRPISKAMTGALDQRAEKIRGELDEATRLREEAQKTLAEYKRKQSEAEKEAEELLEYTKEEAARFRAQAEEDLAASLKRREQAAMEKIAQAEANALAEVRNMAVDIAVAATGKLLSEQMDPAKSDAIVDAAIKDVSAKLH